MRSAPLRLQYMLNDVHCAACSAATYSLQRTPIAAMPKDDNLLKGWLVDSFQVRVYSSGRRQLSAYAGGVSSRRPCF